MSPSGVIPRRAHLFEVQYLLVLQRSLDVKPSMRHNSKMFAAKSLNGRVSAVTDK